MKQVLAFAALCLILGAAYYFIQKPQSMTTYVDSSSTITNEAQKTDAEVYKEAGEKGVEIVLDQVDKHKVNKHTKDSIRQASRKNFWAYQIGVNKGDPEDFKEVYFKLKSIPNIYLFKQARHSFYLIKNDGYTTEQEYNDNKSSVEKAIQNAGLADRVIITNFTTYCDLKDDVVLHGKEKIARGEKVDCYICR